MTMALLPWCTAMGATFPFAMAGIRRMSPTGSVHSFSYLYVANVFGAVLGTLMPAFVLIELFGFRATLWIAASLNVLLAAVVFMYSSRLSVSSEAPAQSVIPSGPATGTQHNLWLLFTTGICSMAIEVICVRLFTPYLGNVVYSFAAILALYLLATFTGSRIYRWWCRVISRSRSAPSGCCWVFVPCWRYSPPILDYASANNSIHSAISYMGSSEPPLE